MGGDDVEVRIDGGEFGVGADNFAPDLAPRLDSQAVLDLLDDKGVDDDYTRQLAVVALKRAAKQASES